MTAAILDRSRLNEAIEASAKSHLESLIALRRRIHGHPEVGFEEEKTAAAAAAYLRELGLGVQTGVGRTGLVSMVKGRGPGPSPGTRTVVAIRADLDALPVQEETGLEFSSTVAGKMHACGHDMHVAMVAGTAAVLADLAGDLAGDVKLLFQPAEESGARTVPGVDPYKVFKRGAGGAQEMIAAGALDNPRPDAIIGVHCWPDLPLGVVGIDPRVAMAGNGSLRVRVIGRGGHGAMPHKTVDPVPVAAEIILALQTIASRRNNPTDPFVLTVATVHGGGPAVNVIADKVELQATIRSIRPGYLDKEVPEMIQRLVRGIAGAHGAECDVACGPGLPVTVNDPLLVKKALQSGTAILGEQGVRLLDSVTMGSEDFAYYTRLVPGVYTKVGVAGEVGCEPLHSARFSPDERAVEVGVKFLARLALDLCREGLGDRPQP
jgi:amidohydrolase